MTTLYAGQVALGFAMFLAVVIVMTGWIENRRDADLAACCSTCRARKSSIAPALRAASAGERAERGLVPTSTPTQLKSSVRPAPLPHGGGVGQLGPVRDTTPHARGAGRTTTAV